MNRRAVLEMIRTRFNSNDPAVESAFDQDRSFRTLCNDYSSCVRVLERLKETDSEQARHREAEYSRLAEHLAEEIRMWLRSMEGTDGKPS